MNFRTLVTALAAAILFAIPATIIGGEPQAGSIRGCLTDTRTNLPLADAWVVIQETNQGARTDSSGCFVIVDVAPGSYHLSVTHSDLGTFKGLPELAVIVVRGKVSKLSLALGTEGKKDDSTAHQKPDLFQSIIDGLGLNKSTQESERGSGRGDQSTFDGGAVQSITPVPRSEGRHDQDQFQKCAPSPDYSSWWDDNRAPADMFFRDYGTNGFVDPRQDRFSTFAVDVDDASYNIVHRYLQDGLMPPQDAVRIEEFINHFNYAYNPPIDETFRVFTEITRSPFERDMYLLKLAVKGREIDRSERRPLYLTFVIDVSGSMGQGNRFELVRESIKALAHQLDEFDRVGIVAYGSQAYEVLNPIPGNRTEEICRAVDRLRVGGSTYAEAGIRLGYEMANRQYVNGQNNVIVLCSDGVANVGRTSPDEIMREVQRFARKGITLSTFGYGMGNYNDVLLEQLATKGNGRYAYINNEEDIRSAMVDGFVGNLQVLARDVKVQVEFNSKTVSAYRLLGYENRAVADEKFRDNRQDGGEIGAGHEVTALYELKLTRGAKAGSLATVNLRWKNSEGTEVFEMSREARMQEHFAEFDRSRPELRLAAVAGRFAEMLKRTGYSGGTSYEKLSRLAEPLRRELPGEQTDDLLDLIRLAGALADRHADRDDRGENYYGDFNYKR